MTWERINKYSIRQAPWIIAKVFVDGCTLYVLSDDAGIRYGHFDSADEAKKFTGAMESGNSELRDRPQAAGPTRATGCATAHLRRTENETTDKR